MIFWIIIDLHLEAYTSISQVFHTFHDDPALVRGKKATVWSLFGITFACVSKDNDLI